MAKRFITVNEAARVKECSRQAIHAAIKAKRLRALPRQVTKTEWEVDMKSLARLVINPRMKRPNGRNGNSRQLCPGCDGQLTSADVELGACTQCGRKL